MIFFSSLICRKLINSVLFIFFAGSSRDDSRARKPALGERGTELCGWRRRSRALSRLFLVERKRFLRRQRRGGVLCWFSVFMRSESLPFCSSTQYTSDANAGSGTGGHHGRGQVRPIHQIGRSLGEIGATLHCAPCQGDISIAGIERGRIQLRAGIGAAIELSGHGFADGRERLSREFALCGSIH